MKIVCVKTPKFLRPFFKLFARKKKRVKCDSAAAVAAAFEGQDAPVAEESENRVA